MKPYKFEPYLKTTIWGGYQIAPFKGIFNAQPNVGESWEISGVPGHESVAINRGLVNDVDEGLTLVELIDKYKELLVGKKIYKKFGNQFPLLVKLIDSRQDLSVQVHPDDKLAMERHGCAGKLCGSQEKHHARGVRTAGNGRTSERAFTHAGCDCHP